MMGLLFGILLQCDCQKKKYCLQEQIIHTQILHICIHYCHYMFYKTSSSHQSSPLERSMWPLATHHNCGVAEEVLNLIAMARLPQLTDRSLDAITMLWKSVGLLLNSLCHMVLFLHACEMGLWKWWGFVQAFTVLACCTCASCIGLCQINVGGKLWCFIYFLSNWLYNRLLIVLFLLATTAQNVITKKAVSQWTLVYALVTIEVHPGLSKAANKKYFTYHFQ